MRGFGVEGDALVERRQSPDIGPTCSMPSLADPDQDRDVEEVTRGAVLDGATGAIELTYASLASGHVIVSDVDGDPDHDLELSEDDERAILLDATTGAFATARVPAGVQECREGDVGELERRCGLM